MENIIVATFTNEDTALQGLHKLNELDFEGDIIVFDRVLIRKNSFGEFEVLKGENSDAWRTLTGMAIGGLLGMFGGPVGLVVGLYAGATIGTVGDISHYAFDQDFTNRVRKSLPNGTTSIIAEVEEDSSVIIDASLKPLGGVIWRTNVYVEHGKFVQQRIDELDAEIHDAVTELRAATESEKAKICAKIDELKSKREDKIAEVKAKSNKKLHELKEKMESNKQKLQAQFSKLETKVSDKIDAVKLERIEKKLAKDKDKLAKYESQIDELKGKMAALKHAKSA